MIISIVLSVTSGISPKPLNIYTTTLLKPAYAVMRMNGPGRAQLGARASRPHRKSEQDVLRSEVLEDFTDEIIELYHAIKQERSSFVELGIDIEEKAFYDILKALTIK